jgi:hypothetical protein
MSELPHLTQWRNNHDCVECRRKGVMADKKPMAQKTIAKKLIVSDEFANMRWSTNGDFAFTGQRVAMLSTVLHSDRAIEHSIHFDSEKQIEPSLVSLIFASTECRAGIDIPCS